MREAATDKRSFGASFAISASVLFYIAYVFCLPVAIRYFSPPALQVDDSYFLLITYSWLNGLGLNNYWANPIGSGIFNWHGFLQPILLAELSPCHTLRCINTALVVLGGAYLAMWYVVVNYFTTNQYLRWALYIIGVSLVIRYSARPELSSSAVLVCIVLWLALFADQDDRYAIRAIGCGIGVATALVASPFTGGFAGLGVAAAIAILRRNDRHSYEFFLEGAIAVISAFCTLVAVFVLIYPYSPIAWIDGILHHAVRDINREDTGGILKYYFFTKELPLLGVMFITLLGVTTLTFKEMREASNRLLFVVFVIMCAAFAYLLYFSSIRIPLTYYNFSALIPALMLIAILCTDTFRSTGQYARTAMMIPIFTLAAACVCSQVIWTTQWLRELPDDRRLSTVTLIMWRN
jgi:hypothetical protein